MAKRSSGALFEVFRRRQAPPAAAGSSTAPVPAIDGRHLVVRIDARQAALFGVAAVGALVFAFLLGRKVGQSGSNPPAPAAPRSAEGEGEGAAGIGRPEDGPYTLRVARFAAAGEADAVRAFLVEERRFPADSVRIRTINAMHVVEVGCFDGPESPRVRQFVDGFAELDYRGEKPFKDCLLVAAR